MIMGLCIFHQDLPKGRMLHEYELISVALRYSFCSVMSHYCIVWHKCVSRRPVLLCDSIKLFTTYEILLMTFLHVSVRTLVVWGSHFTNLEDFIFGQQAWMIDRRMRVSWESMSICNVQNLFDVICAVNCYWEVYLLHMACLCWLTLDLWKCRVSHKLIATFSSRGRSRGDIEILRWQWRF